MKTLEFKLDLNLDQIENINRWCDDLRLVWNKGLALLEEDQQRYWRKKNDYTEDSPEKWEFYRNPKRWSFQPEGVNSLFEGVFGLCCSVSRYDRKREESYPVCDVRPYLTLDDPGKLFNSSSYFNATNLPQLEHVPAKFKVGVHKSLTEAWKRYKQGKARRPKYKSKRDKIRSLVNYNAGGLAKELKPQRIGNSPHGFVSFPKLGKLRVNGLYDRFNPDLGYGVARIVIEPSGYYLQVLCHLEDRPYKSSTKVVGIDPGVTSAVALDNGRQYKRSRTELSLVRRKRRLERKTSRQKLNSSNNKKSRVSLSLVEEKLRRSRKSFNHSLSTKIVREYGSIAIEDTNLKNMIRKPKAKVKADGKGYEKNKAKAKAGLNRSLADVAIGQFRAMLQTKVDTSDNRYMERTKAPYSSQECHSCRIIGDRKGKHFTCTNPACKLHGKLQDADVNAARNHVLNSSLLNSGNFPNWLDSLVIVD